MRVEALPGSRYNAAMTQIHFFDDPSNMRRSREDVRLNQIGLHVYEDGRRVAVGFDLTPFLERPSLEVLVTDEAGEIAGTLNVIEALQPNFHVTMHLRRPVAGATYRIEVVVYYAAPGEARQVVDRATDSFALPAA